MSKKQKWYFTFGQGQKHENRYCVIEGTREEARKRMIEKFGREWAFQYSEDQWVDEKGVSQAEKYNLTKIS